MRTSTRLTLICVLFCLVISTCLGQAYQQGLPPVLVKAKPTLVDGKSVALISQEDMATSGVGTLAQALQYLGGLQLQDTSGNGSQVSLSLRGFGANASSNTLLLVNGIPITNPDMAPPDLNFIPL